MPAIRGSQAQPAVSHERVTERAAAFDRSPGSYGLTRGAEESADCSLAATSTRSD